MNIINGKYRSLLNVKTSATISSRDPFSNFRRLYEQSNRTITIDMKMSNDPYYVLGVSRDAKFGEVKKQYFLLAKKYHPDLNQNNDYANKMFILIQEAYRQIETDHNPLLREARKQAQNAYERNPDSFSSKFKSRRPENKSTGEKAFWEQDDEGSNHQERVHDWHEEKFLRRYRYQHLRSDTSVPMSIRNVDRHGLGNLQHDAVKPLDRLKIPPWLLYLLVFSAFAYVAMTMQESEEANLEELSKKNILFAMKKTQEKLEYEQEEITPAEEITMKSTQYREIVEKQGKKEREKLDAIKSLVLLEGRSTSKTKKVDLRDLQDGYYVYDSSLICPMQHSRIRTDSSMNQLYVFPILALPGMSRKIN